MKIKYLLIVFLIVIIVLVVLIIFRVNYNSNILIEDRIINQQKILDKGIESTNVKISISTNSELFERFYRADTKIDRKIATNSNYINSDINNSNNKIIYKTLNKEIIEDDAFIYHDKNWLIEDIVVDTKKDELSILERLKGKKANVTKITNRVYKWLKDPNNINSYVNNTYVLIPIAEGSQYAYKYYFDNDGYLIRDNISNDYTVLDKYGREIDSELNPIEYFIGNKSFGLESIEKEIDGKESGYGSKKSARVNSTPSQVIITEGVVFKKKLSQIYNTKIDTDITKYIKSGLRYSNNVKATIYTNAKWKKALKLDGDNSYVVFENFAHNFNKIFGKVSMGAVYSNDTDTVCKVYVYDKDEYDTGNFSDYIICIDDFNYKEPQFFSFTFDRSIKNIVFLLEITGGHRTKSIFFKDLKFGFNKNAYREELIRKSENEEEIQYLKSLGLYIKNDNYFDIIDDDGNLLIDDDVFEDREYLSSYDKYEEYKTDLMDYTTGPDYDKELKKKDLDNRLFGPYIDIIGTSSNVSNEYRKKKRQSKIIYTN